MPAYYSIELYINPKNINGNKLVNNTINKLLTLGCKFKSGSVFNEGKEIRVDLRTIRKSITRDIEKWKFDFSNKFKFSNEIIFQYDFEFAELTFTKSYKFEDEMKDIRLYFIHCNDSMFGYKIIVTILIWEELVLMYGFRDVHKRNMQKIVTMVMNLYETIKPYFGWMDGEMNSNDESFGPFINGESFVNNNFVIIGAELIHKLNINEINNSDHSYKNFSDGGIIIQWSGKKGINYLNS